MNENRPELLKELPVPSVLLKAIHPLVQQYGLGAVSRALGVAESFTLADCPDCGVPECGHCRNCDGCGQIPTDPDWEALIAAAEAAEIGADR